MNSMLVNAKRKPWLKYYPKETLFATPPECSLIAFIKERCKKNQAYDLPALSYYGRKISYRFFFEKTDEYARAFRALGVRPGDYVSFVTVGTPEAIYAFYGLNRIGAACNMIDPRTDAEHTAEYIRKANSKILICLENIWEKVSDVIPEMNHVIVQTIGESLPFFKKPAFRIKQPKCDIPYSMDHIIDNRTFKIFKNQLSLQDLPEDNWGMDQPAAVTRTGGSTGISKGVILTNGSINAVVDGASKFGLRAIPGETLLNFLPIASSYGVVCGMHLVFTQSQTNITIPVFKPEDFPDLVIKYKPNSTIGVPTFYETLMRDPRFDRMDLSFFKQIVVGGDSPNEALEDELEAFFNAHHAPYGMTKGYGMSETTSATVTNIYEIKKRGSVGIPYPYTDIAIFEPGTDHMLPVGEVGEICIAGPTLMKGYLNEPEETAHVLKRHSDGKFWMHSGDLGCFDQDGFIFLKGRIKRSIIRFDGHKSYPVQIENVVSRIPDIEDCCVVSVKDRDHSQGDLPLIIARATNTVKNPEKLKKAVMDFCREKIEERSQPAGVVIVDRLPLNNMEKIDLPKLSEMYYHYNYRRG